MSAQLVVVASGDDGVEHVGTISAWNLIQLTPLPGVRGPVSVRLGCPCGCMARHLVYDNHGRDWKLEHVPVGAVLGRNMTMVSDCDPSDAEVVELDASGHEATSRLVTPDQGDIRAYVADSMRAGRHVVLEGHHSIMEDLCQLGIAPWAPYVAGLTPWVTFDVQRWNVPRSREALVKNGERVKVALLGLETIEVSVANLGSWQDVCRAWYGAPRWLDERERELGTKVNLLGTGPLSLVWMGN